MKHAITVLLLLASFSALAEDNSSEREAAADRYLQAVPMSQLLDDISAEFVKFVPEEKRTQTATAMKALLRVDMLTVVTRKALVETFTTEELNALADFYSSPHGSSAMRKMGPYMSKLMPLLVQEIQRAAKQMQAQKQSTPQ